MQQDLDWAFHSSMCFLFSQNVNLCVFIFLVLFNLFHRSILKVKIVYTENIILPIHALHWHNQWVDWSKPAELTDVLLTAVSLSLSLSLPPSFTFESDSYHFDMCPHCPSGTHLCLTWWHLALMCSHATATSVSERNLYSQILFSPLSWRSEDKHDQTAFQSLV